MTHKRLLVLFTVVALAMSGAALAQEQAGSIEGTIVDNTGAALPGVTVEALTPAGTKLMSITDHTGLYRFPRLSVGIYKLTATLSGFVTSEATDISLSLGKTLRVNFTLRLGAITEEITVTAEQVTIDETKSATATSINRQEIDLLPRGRDFTSVVTQAAGVVNERQAGGISIDGATGLENRFIIDGIDITDPQTGEASVPMRADFFDEIQVKSAGYAAEYGGSTGGVINAITRSGHSVFQGGLNFEYQDSSLNGGQRPTLQYKLADPDAAEHQTYRKDDYTRMDPGLWLSGPIIKDRLFFFATYQPGLLTTKRTVTFPGVGPNETDLTDTYKQDTRTDYMSFNTTANLGPVLLKLGGNLSPYEQKRSLPGRDGRSGQYDQAAYAAGDKGERSTYSLTADYLVSDSFVLSGRLGYYRTNNWTTNVPPPPDEQVAYTGNSPLDTPAEWAHKSGWANYIIQTTTQRDIYTRKSGAIDGSWFFNAAGDHSLKAGFQREQIGNDVVSGWNVGQQRYFWGRSYTTMGGESVTGKYGYMRIRLFQTAGVVDTNNDALFVQDAWTIGKNLTINYGLRAEHEKVPNYGPDGPQYVVDFKYGDKIAPRLGFAWDPKGDQKFKVYGSYGTYYDVMKYELPRGSFGGDKWVDYLFKIDNADPGVNQIATCTSGPNTTFWQPICPGATFIELVNQRSNAADPNHPLIDPKIKPMETWETQLGVENQLTDRIRLSARYVHKELVRAIEDMGVTVNGEPTGEYYIGNPGEGNSNSIAPRPWAKPERKYDAIELTFDRRFADNWMFIGTYTYSRLYGNYSGLASSDEENAFGDGARLSPNASRLFDSVINSYDRNGKLVYGHLATERPHQFKINALYRTPFNLAVGVSQYAGSGTPISENALGPLDVPFYPYGRGNLGRTPWLFQTDLSLNQNFDLGGFNFVVALNVTNLFDSRTVTRYWSTRNRQAIALSMDEFFAGGWDYEQKIAELGPTGQDPAFMMADNYQAPRELRLTFRFSF